MSRTLNTVVIGAAAAGTMAMGTTGLAHADTPGYDGWQSFTETDEWESFDAEFADEMRDLDADEASDLHTFDLPTSASTFTRSSGADDVSEYQGRHRTSDDDVRGFSAVRDSDGSADYGDSGSSNELDQVSTFSENLGRAAGGAGKAAGPGGKPGASAPGAGPGGGAGKGAGGAGGMAGQSAGGAAGGAGGMAGQAAGGAAGAAAGGAAGAAGGGGKLGLVSGLVTQVGQVVVPTLQKLGL